MPYPSRLGIPGWNDFEVNLDRAKVSGGPTDATYAEISGGWNLYAWRFATDKYIQFTCQLNHTYRPGTNITPHVHWCPADANAGNVAWRLEYSLAKPNSTNWASPTVLDATPAATAGVAFRHQIASFGAIDLSANLTPSTVFLCRLGRISTGDTYGSNVFAVSFDFHYVADRDGSASILSY